MPSPSVVEIQEQWADLWVAVVDGEVVEARPMPGALVLALGERNIVGATILRCPAADKPELVGLG